MAAPRAFWLGDVKNVPATERRLALYTLQLIQGTPELIPRFVDRDFLGALWQLLKPVIRPQAVTALVMQSKAIEDEERILSDREANERELLDDHERCHHLRQRFSSVPQQLVTRLARADGENTLSPTVALLGKQLGLDTTEVAILDFLDQRTMVEPLRMLLRECSYAPARTNLKRFATMLGRSPTALKTTLSRRSPLQALGLIEVEREQCDLEDYVRPSDLLRDVLNTAPADGDALLAMLIEPAPGATWSLGSFPHLTRAGERLTRILGEAASTSAGGINALFYGTSGTGKTEFARAVATAAGLVAYQIRSDDEDHAGLSREGRLSAYLLAQRLLARRHDALLIFDEVEDVFESPDSLLALLSGGKVTGRQKGWMNRILEENPVPAIWITNGTDGMDPAFLRRFLLPVPFRTPPRSVRRQMTERHLGDAGLSPDLLDTLASDPTLTPAQMGAARRLLELSPDSPPEMTVREGIAAMRQLLHGAPAPRQREPATAFDVAYLNLARGISPSAIAQALNRAGRGCLCFYGPPGTGKTAFAELLAEALDRELVTQCASDLLSPYIGETEQNLARLFTTHDPNCTVLFLDEVDGFLAERHQAQRSWERTQVNELLQQMERWPGIFIAATNLMSGLDTAALRRFDFKLHFQALTSNQRLSLFAREALGDAQAILTPQLAHHLERLDGLTPGDFATVCRQQRLLGQSLTPDQFLRQLAAEWQSKTPQQTGTH